MEPTFRYGTRKAIDELAVELNLPNENWMQDWPIEVIANLHATSHIQNRYAAL